MPHVDISMFPGRDNARKNDLALKVQRFLADELQLEERFVSVSIQDIPRERWEKHMKQYAAETLFVHPDMAE